MKRKGPPYKVEFSKNGDKPPAYVSEIRDGKILISGSIAELSKRGLKRKIVFNSAGNLTKNRELINIVIRLNNAGIAFSYDYKSGLSPSDFMKELQDLGELKQSFNEISWKSPTNWLITTYEIE